MVELLTLLPVELYTLLPVELYRLLPVVKTRKCVAKLNSTRSNSHSTLKLDLFIALGHLHASKWLPALNRGGLSNWGAGPSAFSDRGCLLFSERVSNFFLLGGVCLGNVNSVELLSTPCLQRSF